MTDTFAHRHRGRRLGLLGSIAAMALALAAPAAASTASFVAVTTVLGLDYPLQPGDYVWDEDGVPAGPTRIVVDLDAERIYVYRGGVEIGRSFIIYGADEKPTPLGVFPILEKDREHYSNLYYGAPMPYMLRLTMDGVAIHGSEVAYDLATHGCIGLPDEFAAILFSKARVGDRVLVTRGWMPSIYGD